MLHVLVAEDSSASREYLVHILTQDPTIQVVATARDGREAVREVQRCKPHVVLMDVYMPRMNGLEATREIMHSVPTPIVMMSARTPGSEAKMTFDAIHAGALTFVDKPNGMGADQTSAQRVIEMVKLMAEVKVIRRWARREALPSLGTPLPRPRQEVRLIAIGASTGGPPALMEILQRMPANLGVPILLVQHITPGFAEGLAEWLDAATGVVVKLAEDGERLEPGRGYLAPDGVQMVIGSSAHIQLTAPWPEQGFCPSIDRMFASVAATYGASAIGVILTGMGRDGAVGLRRLRESGGLTIAQDEATSAVFGMPKEAIRLNAAMHILPLQDIAQVIRDHTLFVDAR